MNNKEYSNGLITSFLEAAKCGNTQIFAVKYNKRISFDIEKIRKIFESETNFKVYDCAFTGDIEKNINVPFLNIIKHIYTEYYSDIPAEDFCRDAGVYPVQIGILSSYLKDGICIRQEPVVLFEFEYEKSRLIESLVNLYEYCIRDKRVLIVINDIHYSSGITFEVIKKVLQDNKCKNFNIMFTYNAMYDLNEYTSSEYRDVIEEIDDRYGIMDGGLFGDCDFIRQDVAYCGMEKTIHQSIIDINNLIQIFDVNQAEYYLKHVEEHICRRHENLDEEDKLFLGELKVILYFYKKNMASVVKRARNLLEMDFENEEYRYEAKVFAYQYMCQSYLLRIDVEGCNEIIRELSIIGNNYNRDYPEFLAELYEKMIIVVKRSNSSFIYDDIELSQEFIDKAYKYGYINHLANIYIYCFDSTLQAIDKMPFDEDMDCGFCKGIRIAKKLDNKFLIIQAYKKNIILALAQGRSEVSDYYYKEWSVLNEETDKFSLANIYNGLGYNLCSNEKYEEAHEKYLIALDMFKELGMVQYIGETLYNMSMNCMLARKFEDAYVYLKLIIKIIDKLNINDLRVCNITKIYGLMALCSLKTGKMYDMFVSLEKSRQFLTYMLEDDYKSIDETEKAHVHADDDLILYYMVTACVEYLNKNYEAVFENMKECKKSMDRSIGFWFFCKLPYHAILYWNYMSLGMKKKAQEEVDEYVSYCKEHRLYDHEKNFLEETCIKGAKTQVSPCTVTQDFIDSISRNINIAATKLESENVKNQMEFLNVWQQLLNRQHSEIEVMQEEAFSLFCNYTAVDGFTFISCENGEFRKVYEKGNIKLDLDKIDILIGYFDKNHKGFVTSMQKGNFLEYNRYVKILESKRVCSMLCIPFYKNDKLVNICVAYCFVRDEKNIVTKIFMDEQDYKWYELVFYQYIEAVDRIKDHFQLQEVNAKLEEAVIKDYLTNLYNRAGLSKELENMVSKAAEEGRELSVAVLYIDLDNFKFFNDQFGHDVGDIVLKGLTDVLVTNSDDEDIPVRFGGDEFLIILPYADRKRAEEKAKKIVDDIDRAGSFKERIEEYLNSKINIPESKNISCSIGIACHDSVFSKQNIMQIVKEADSAMYRVKNSGKHGCSF